jgi:hypothetical protein
LASISCLDAKVISSSATITSRLRGNQSAVNPTAVNPTRVFG